MYWSISATSSLGTPNGQASTQLPQPMQRSLAASWTTPSAVTRMASAGQTSAQGATGSSQCMHTVGMAAAVRPASM